MSDVRMKLVNVLACEICVGCGCVMLSPEEQDAERKRGRVMCMDAAERALDALLADPEMVLLATEETRTKLRRKM